MKASTLLEGNTKSNNYKVTCNQKPRKFYHATANRNSHLIIKGATSFDLTQIRNAQIKLVGSEKIYKIVNSSLESLKFEPYFCAEQFKLYKWRKDFFHQTFGFAIIPLEESIWTCYGSAESHAFDTVPYQLTRQFGYVTELACCTLNLVRGPKVYFEADESWSTKAINLFDRDHDSESTTSGWAFKMEALNNIYELSISDCVHLLGTLFFRGPPSLEHLAIKKALEYQLDMKKLPLKIQKKAKVGMFESLKKIPEFLNEEGQHVLDQLLSQLY